jgi:O-antigen/teichoic acid export membrane protein
VFLGEARGLQGVALHRFFLRTITLFTALGIAGMLPVLLFAPPVFIVVFGEAWYEAGVLVQLLVPFFFSRFVVFPISQLVHVLKRQDVYLFSAVLNVLALGLSFGSGLLFALDVQVTVLLFSLTVTLANLVTLAISWHLVALNRRPRAAARGRGDEPRLG